MSDSELMRGLRDHDPVAFQRVREHYVPSIWRYVLSRVDCDLHVTEDIVSETMLALIEAFDSMETDATILNLGGWLRAVANHKVQDYFRTLGRVRHLMEEARQQAAESNPADNPVRQEETKERRLEVRRAMDRLPEQYRIGLEWKYVDKLSVREISERWGTTEKAVESILFRARREFRKRLQGTVPPAAIKAPSAIQSPAAIQTAGGAETQAENLHGKSQPSPPGSAADQDQRYSPRTAYDVSER